jgi:hypothetical protein
MRNLTASFMALVVYSLVVSLSSNAYAFSYAMKHLPFRLTESDDLNSSMREIFRGVENWNVNTEYDIDEQEKGIFDSGVEPIYAIQKSHKKSDYAKATIETLTILGFVSLVYWASNASSYDYDYDVKFNTLWKKLSGKAIRFDDNNIELNSFPGHPLSGAYYYLIARNNNLSRTGSFVWSFAASTISEFLIEFREVASISDLVVTPVAGATIGEAMYALGKYFRCAENKGDWLDKMFAVVLDPIAAAHNFVWSDVPSKYSQGDMCHYTPLQKDVSIFTGANVSYHNTRQDANIGSIFGFHGTLYLIPQYGQEADINRFFKEPILSEIGIEASVTEQGVDTIRFLAKTVWAAYYRQHIARAPTGQTTGYSFFVGLASAFDHIQYDTGEFEDWIGAVHVFGPSLELASFHRAGYIRIGLDVFADFAMVRSYAFDMYKKNHSINNIKSVLRHGNYYYAYGAYVNPKIEVRYGSHRFVAEYKYARYDSIEGRDRRKISNDFHLGDEQQEYGFVVGQLLNFFDGNFFKKHDIWIEAEVRSIARSGFIADSKVSHEGRNTWLLLRFRMML